MQLNRSWVTWLGVLLAPAAAVVAGTWIAASTWERVRTQPAKRTIRVTGSATERIQSDLIEWRAELSVKGATPKEAYGALKEHAAATVAFLKGAGLADAEIFAGSVDTQELFATEYTGVGEERIERQVSGGWEMRQGIQVRSTKVPVVEQISRDVTGLLEKGVPVSSTSPLYHYTKLGDLKITILARASEDARTRGEKILAASGGGTLGKLVSANMGVINVNPANATATSWDGNNDKSSLDKDVIGVVHLGFEVD